MCQDSIYSATAICVGTESKFLSMYRWCHLWVERKFKQNTLLKKQHKNDGDNDDKGVVDNGEHFRTSVWMSVLSMDIQHTVIH